MVRYDIGTTQCDDGTVKCEKKKKREPLNVIKSTVKCDVGIAQCDNGTIKCEKKKTK